MRAYCCHPLALEALLSRGVEEGECLIWQGAMVQGRHPVIRVGGVQHYVRRLVFELTSRALKPDERVSTRCATLGCIEPRCLVGMSPEAITRRAAAAGAFRTLKHRAAVARGKRLRSALSDAAVAEIRFGTDDLQVAAERHGISRAYARMIRGNQSRVDFTSPWAALGAIRILLEGDR